MHVTQIVTQPRFCPNTHFDKVSFRLVEKCGISSKEVKVDDAHMKHGDHNHLENFVIR